MNSKLGRAVLAGPGAWRTGRARPSIGAVVHYGGPVDHPPVAVNVSAWTTPGQAVTIGVLANDSDPDGDPLALRASRC